MLNRLRTVVAAAMLTVATYAAAQAVGEHPETYVVRKGDTLWDIAGRFLQKPWLWPEIWQANPQIQNPHLIYPGDVISLAYLDRVAKGTVQPGPRQEAPINAIPLADVEPFLKNLRVTDDFDQLPYVVGLEGGRTRATTGQVAYVVGLDNAQPGQRFAVVRPTVSSACPSTTKTSMRPATSPQAPATSGRTTSRRARAASSSATNWHRSTSAPSRAARRAATQGGHPAAAGQRPRGTRRRSHRRRRGAALRPAVHPASAVGTGPADRIAGAGHLRCLHRRGTRDVIAISGGAREGINNGTVFSIWRKGRTVSDRVKHSRFSRTDDDFSGPAGSTVGLPDEYASHAMVFRTFDKVSYALVMESVKPTGLGYFVKHPDAQ